MSTSSSEEAEMLMCSPADRWSSVESIFTQKIAKLTKSESLFNPCSKFTPSLTFSELELREIRLKNFKEKTPKWELVKEKTKIPRMVNTKSLLKDELEILKINLSMNDNFIEYRLSELKDFKAEANRKKNKKLVKFMKKPLHFRKIAPAKVRDLLTEIEGSETAKTDTVIWKFLKRGPSFRKDYVNARKLLMEIQALQLPGMGFLSDSRFQNSQPIKVTCPNCTFFITTQIKKISSIRTKFISIILAVLGLCIVPHILYAYKDTIHLCPLCKIYLGFCPAFNIRTKRNSLKLISCHQKNFEQSMEKFFEEKMVSASSTSAKNLFVESKLRLSDRVQVNVNNIAAITRQIQRGSKANENLITAAKNFALQEAAIENSETNLKKLKLLTTHINNQLDSLHNSSLKMEMVLEQVRSMQR